MGLRVSREAVRSRMPDVNDGVLAVAGLTEGLSLVVRSAALPVIVMVAAIAGAVSVAGVRYAPEAAEREIQLDIIAQEQRLWVRACSRALWWPPGDQPFAPQHARSPGLRR